MHTPAPAWRKSSYCGNAQCVEVATTPDGPMVRDNKDLDGPTLAFTPTAWSAFTTELRRGGLRA